MTQEDSNAALARHMALLQRYQAGDFAGMAASARQMLQEYPQDGKVWHLLGVAALQTGEAQVAEEVLGRACELIPGDAEVWDHQGLILCRLKQYARAKVCFDRSLSLAGERSATWCNATKNAVDAGWFAEGVRYGREAVAKGPDYAGGWCNLGNALLGLGEVNESVNCFHKALALNPQMADGFNNLGNALKELGRLAEAEACYRRALALDPGYAKASNNLGIALREQGRLELAAASFSQALTLLPDYAEAYNNLGNVQMEQGRMDLAKVSFRRAMTLDPERAEYFNNLLFARSHDGEGVAEEVFAEHLAFGERFEKPWRDRWPQHANDRDPERRLRLGFVSGDLWGHALGYFLEPVWSELNPAKVEIWAYSNNSREDSMSNRLRDLSHVWRKVVGMSDDDLTAQIIADQIDILFDMSGHTAQNRLLTFVRKPAPVQVAWIGYPNTTGLQSMDYLLCDRFNAPYGFYEHLGTEKLARLPTSTTFQSMEEAPPVNPLPALTRGWVTFGSFNRISKLNDLVIDTWSQVLRAVAGSRLLMGNVNDAALAADLTARFAQRGIEAHRLILHPKVPLTTYLTLHHEVDILLDTFPYTSGTTNKHALWMGVPTVTITGPSRAHCQSAAALGRMGLEDWVVRDLQSFVQRAVTAANQLEELAQLRAGMRERWHNSPLRQPATVARGVEHGVRLMWKRWCAGLPAESFEVVYDSLVQ